MRKRVRRKAWGLERFFQGSRACLIFAFPFVPTLLSESLEQANISTDTSVAAPHRIHDPSVEEDGLGFTMIDWSYETRKRVDQGCFVDSFARWMDKGLKSTL